MKLKFFIASFNRASDGAISLLSKKMKDKDMLVQHYKDSDYILAVGDRKETFEFVLERFRENRKIIHLWAGEISQGTHDEVYRHSITMMSMMQLCTNHTAKERVLALCKAIDKKPNAYVVGNVMLDNLEIDTTMVPNEPYDVILYNPPTELNRNDIINEINIVRKMIFRRYFWIEPNGDFGSELVKPFVTDKTIEHKKFLGLLKNCERFITNSSSMFYEAPFLMKDTKNIISIGMRNINRESKYTNMTLKDASDNILNIFKRLKNG